MDKVQKHNSFNTLSVSFCITFLSDGIALSINKQFHVLLLIIVSVLLAITSLSVCTP
jgi:hypothetical protein